MQKLGEAVTKSLIPFIDFEKMIAPKQFASRADLEKYFLEDVDNLFTSASYMVEDKEYFHQVNHIIPFLRLLLVQTNEKECGSTVANNIGKNKALEAGEEYGPKFGYPFPEDKCYSTFVKGDYKTASIKDVVDETGEQTWLNYTKLETPAGNGLLNSYKNNGFSKVIKLAVDTEKHFYK